MSNRTIKKLQNKGKILSSMPIIDDCESDSSPEEKSSNKFISLLNDLPSDPDVSGSGLVEVNMTQKIKSKQNIKRRKKKKRYHNKLTDNNEKEDEIDRCVREVNELLGEVSPVKSVEGDLSEKEQDILLSVCRKFLDPMIEMKRIFGAKVVDENNKSQRRNNNIRHSKLNNRNKKCVIMGGSAPYPEGRKVDLSMEVEMEYEGCVYYRFVHLPAYQKVQFAFNKIVNTINPESIISFLHENPLHIDSLLTASEIHRIAEEPSTAAKLIEKAIYVMENAFHPQFTYSTGKCRMNYRQQENRAFFILIFRLIMNMERKGCNRTALELCKLLLNLAPDTDPLGASLMLDYYAIRAQEYAWLVSLYDCYEGAKNLSMLPNFSFSVPLALYHLSTQKRRQPEKNGFQHKVLSLTPLKIRERADLMLQQALIMFPGALALLLDKCSVKADQAVLDHPYFSPQSQISMTKGLTAIVTLFIGRNFYLWKEQGVMQWLEENVKKAIERIDNNDHLIEECKEKRKDRYLGTPNPIYRHIIISEIKDVTISLPDNIARMAVMSHDPLPPPDNICGYKFPKETRSRNSESIVSSFFRSLMPNYDAAGGANFFSSDDEDAEPEGNNAATAEIRENVATIIEGLRDFAAAFRRDIPDIDFEENEQQN